MKFGGNDQNYKLGKASRKLGASQPLTFTRILSASIDWQMLTKTNRARFLLEIIHKIHATSILQLGHKYINVYKICLVILHIVNPV